MYSLRTKILLIVLVFLAFIGTAFVFYSIVTTVNYKRLRLDGIEKTVAFESEKVNRIIAAIERDAISLSRDGLLYYKFQSSEISEISVLEYLRSFPTVIGGGLWFEPYAYNKEKLRAGIYAFNDKAKGEVRLDEFEMDEYDYHNENWYREIADAIQQPYQVVWTKPYLDDTSFCLVTTAGAGIYDDAGRLIAVSNIDWEIDEMVNELFRIKPTESSFVLLCAPEHSLIISSTYNSEKLTSLNDIHWDIHAGSFFLNGSNYLTFSRDMDNGWLLSVSIPEREIFAEIESQNNRYSMIIAFSSVVMLVLAYAFISRLINAPIGHLIKDVAQLALGNLEIRVRESSRDELGMLGRAFNKMTSDLKISIEAYTREHTEKQRIAAELNIAAKIQASMLPCIFPPFPDKNEFDIYASMLPAKEIGGDFYDFYFIDENNLAVTIADVSGKGVPAALFMVIAKTLIKNTACSGKSPKEVFETVNNMLNENNDAGMFASAFMGYYNLRTGKFLYVNAGHNPPLIKKSGGEYGFLSAKPCLVLGCIEDIEYREEEITLEPGDTLFLYTDGVTESMNADRDFFSESRLLEVSKKCRDLPPKELLAAIKQEIDGFAGDAEQADDITMLALGVVHLSEPSIKEITVDANTDNLSKVICFINNELAQYDCPPDTLKDIDAAVEEIFVNIAKYAYKQAEGKAVVGIIPGAETVIHFEDSGKPFNPLEKSVPDFDKPPIDREIGGLGVYLVRKLMDEVDYSRINNKNILVMKKRLDRT